MPALRAFEKMYLDEYRGLAPTAGECQPSGLESSRNRSVGKTTHNARRCRAAFQGPSVGYDGLGRPSYAVSDGPQARRIEILQPWAQAYGNDRDIPARGPEGERSSRRTGIGGPSWSVFVGHRPGGPEFSSRGRKPTDRISRIRKARRAGIVKEALQSNSCPVTPHYVFVTRHSAARSQRVSK